MIDDGVWAGVPLGGLGTGSIGPTFRGDVARWHLEVGRHAFRPVVADGFSVFVEGPAGRRATRLSAYAGDELRDWPGLAVGAGTYHALFPRAWWTFGPEDLGIRLTGEQLSPVIAGDYASSALPVGVVEWWADNPGPEPLTVGLLLSWANPLGARPGDPAPAGPWQEIVQAADSLAIRFHDGGVGPAGLRGTFAIAAAAGDGVELSARPSFDPLADRELWADFAADGRLDRGNDADGTPAGGRPGPDAGAAVAATFQLGPGERRAVRFAIAWDLPVVEFGAGRRWWKRYTRAWGRSGTCAVELARHALREAPEWRAAIEAWQEPILGDPGRPAWYTSALFNELYFLVDGGTFWEAGEVGGPEPAPGDPGRFALVECPDYAYYDTVDVDFYASFAVLRLFPELERAGIRDLLAAVDVADPREVVIEASGARAERKVAGTVPHDLGGPDDDPFHRPNWYRFQDVSGWKDLAPKLVLQGWRDAALLGDEALLDELRPHAEAVLARLAAADRDGDGLPDHDGVPDQTYDTWPMHGPSAYGGFLWLAAVRVAERLAERDGDAEAASRWAGVAERGTASLERRLWRDHGYFAYDGGGASSESVMADQLAGQWYADVTGLGDLVAPWRISEALRTIHRTNVCGFAGGTMGAVNGMRPDGTVDRSSEQSQEVWVGTTYALAAAMIGRGLVEEGWSTARGAARVTYERGLWFRTPEAYDEAGNFRASLYLRPLAIWAIEDALERRARAAATAGQ